MTVPLPMHDDNYRRDLGNGLLLRWSRGVDADAIAHLYGTVFRRNAEESLNARIGTWARVMMSGRHPLIGPTDFALVEDTRRQAVVAATCLMSQTWEYAGIPIPIGRPEVVASDPDYRNRGLVRAVFELIHARSEARGHLVQGITGIAYYYRQFGYEYALDLEGHRKVDFTAIPKLKEGESEPFGLRDATSADLPLVMALYERECADSLVSTRIDEPYRRFILDGGLTPESLTPESGEGWRTRIIEDSGGHAQGYVLTRCLRYGDALSVIGLMVEPKVALVQMIPAVLRALQVQASATPAWRPDAPAAASLLFMLGRSHPVYAVLGEGIAPYYRPPYAWYVRVPDLPGFIRHIAPVLEERLAASPVTAGYTGELKMEFYRGGLRLAFGQGKLTASEAYQRPIWNVNSQAGFPPLVFLQLLFGRRSLSELRYAFPDVWASDEAVPLLETLFPARLSRVLHLD